jgi:hypothetical protein
MYRYVQSPEFVSAVSDYTQKKIIKNEVFNKFLNELSGSPRAAKKAHPLKKPFSNFNIWSAHLKVNKAFFTTLYLICDDSYSSCAGGATHCKHFIEKCNKPSEQIVLLKFSPGEPYKSLGRFFT